jgi:hypothetical protein
MTATSQKHGDSFDPGSEETKCLSVSLDLHRHVGTCDRSSPNHNCTHSDHHLLFYSISHVLGISDSRTIHNCRGFLISANETLSANPLADDSDQPEAW